MAKPKNPLLSLGARGTIADSLTFQKRGRRTIARQKPIPTDPKSPAQLAQRQRYKEAVATWHSLTPQEKEAWRGVCPGLTAYQCFMRSELKYVPPLVPLYMGSEAKDRPNTFSAGNTILLLNTPASAAGKITSVEIWASISLENCKVAIFFNPFLDRYTTRSQATIGPVTAGSKQVFEVDLAVQVGDYIGLYWSAGKMEATSTGEAGIWYKTGDYIPCTAETFTNLPFRTMSLYGIGIET